MCLFTWYGYLLYGDISNYVRVYTPLSSCNSQPCQNLHLQWKEAADAFTPGHAVLVTVIIAGVILHKSGSNIFKFRSRAVGAELNYIHRINFYYLCRAYASGPGVRSWTGSIELTPNTRHSTLAQTRAQVGLWDTCFGGCQPPSSVTFTRRYRTAQGPYLYTTSN